MADVLHAVVYSDGGARPTNPGPAGFGVHGYFYSEEEPKKAVEVDGAICTAKGYISKTEMTEETKAVSVVSFFDYTAAMPEHGSSPRSELAAAVYALRFLLERQVKTVQLFADSQYVLRGATEFLHNWSKNHWKKADGTSVLNMDLWKELLLSLSGYAEIGTTWGMTWVKGHNGNVGNTKADELATTACSHAINNNFSFKNLSEYTPADIKSYDSNRPDLMHLQRLYFNTQTSSIREGEYFMGSEDEPGKAIVDNAYCVLRLAEPVALIEDVRKRQTQVAMESDTVSVIYLENFYKPKNHRMLSENGVQSAIKLNLRNDLMCSDGTPLTREYTPALLAIRAVEAISGIGEMLDKYQNQQGGFKVTDITDKLYGAATKKKAGKELNPTFKVGLASFDVELTYEALAHQKDATAEVKLRLGFDLPDRNTLKRIETVVQKVEVLTWPEGSNAFRYATVITTDKDIGIWSSYYANLRIVA